MVTAQSSSKAYTVRFVIYELVGVKVYRTNTSGIICFVQLACSLYSDAAAIHHSMPPCVFGADLPFITYMLP